MAESSSSLGETDNPQNEAVQQPDQQVQLMDQKSSPHISGRGLMSSKKSSQIGRQHGYSKGGISSGKNWPSMMTKEKSMMVPIDKKAISIHPDHKSSSGRYNRKGEHTPHQQLSLDHRSISVFNQDIPKLSGYYSYDETSYSLDLAFLYADPLLQEISIVDHRGKEIRKEIESFNQPLGTDQEFEKIVEAVTKTGKHFTIMKEVANYENLKQVLAQRPLMLHISCHGDCYWDTKVKPPKNTFFLAFEGTDENLCMLDKLTEERLRDLLGNGSNHRLLVVFVSACHSEVIGQLFKRVGVPVVVAVNSHTAILDDVCKLFARHFYQHLAAGNTPFDSYEAGKGVVRSSKQDLFSCCCAHKHKSWCKWRLHFSKRENNKDKDAAHNAHIPNHLGTNCNCAQIGYKHNEHKKSCKFAKDFEKNYVDMNQEIFMMPSEDGTKVKVCCCSPEIPHDETQKLKIIERTYDIEECPKELQVVKKKKKSKQMPPPPPIPPVIGNPTQSLLPSNFNFNFSQLNNPLGSLASPSQNLIMPGGLVQPQALQALPGLPLQNEPESSDEPTSDEDIEMRSRGPPTEDEKRQFREYEKHVLRTPLIINRKQGAVEVKGIKESANQLKAQIDHKLLIGRNKLICDIVHFLNNDQSRLLHLYGEDEMGKADIVNYAGKYALYGRVTLEGALYVEADNKNTINGLIQRICQRLSEKILIPQVKDEYSRENLIGVLHGRKMLIIIDKTKSLLADAKDSFSRFLEQLVQRTLKNKFIIITNSKSDLDSDSSNDYLKQIEVPPLTKRDAAQLLMKVAKNSSSLSKFKSEDELAKHKIFQVFPLKPQVIVQLGMLLETKTLDQIVEEDERLKKQEEEKRQKEIEAIRDAEEQAELQRKAAEKLNSRDEIFDPEEEKQQRERSLSIRQQQVQNQAPSQPSYDLIMKLNFEELLKYYSLERHPYEYELLYILCQMPKGLYDGDMEQISSMYSNFGMWQQMFQRISDDSAQQQTPGSDPVENEVEKLISGKGSILGLGASQQMGATEVNVKRFKFLKTHFDVTLLESLYIPIPMFREFINNQLAEKMEQKIRQKYFNEAIKYLAQLSRRLLKSKAFESRNDFDIRCVSAVLNAGIWESEYGQSQTQQRLPMLNEGPTASFNPRLMHQSVLNNSSNEMQESNYLIKYYFHEGNFVHFLNIKQLMNHLQALNYKEDSAATDIQELAICTISMMIELNQLEEAASLIERCDILAKHYNLIPLQAKLILLQATLSIKQRNHSQEGLEERIAFLKIASKIFKNSSQSEGIFKDGIADSLYLQAIFQIDLFSQGSRKFQPQKVQASQALLPSQPQQQLNSTQFQIPAPPQQKQPFLQNSDQSGNWDNTKLHDLIKNTRDRLTHARQIYEESNVKFGVAKASLIEAEFLIDLIFGYFQHNLDLSETYSHVNFLLTTALDIFKAMKYENLEARTLKNLGYLKFKKYTYDQSMVQANSQANNRNVTGTMVMGTQYNDIVIQDDLIAELNGCLEYFNQAKKIFEKIGDLNWILVLNDYINQILEEVRKNSSNVLIFAKAFPLVEDPMFTNPWDQMQGMGGTMAPMRASNVSGTQLIQNMNMGEVKQIGALTRYKTDFKTRVMSVAKQSQQSLNVKFDILNREILNYVANHGCKLLHISSHAFDEDRLCIEGPNGLVDYLTIDQIIQQLSIPDQQLEVEIIVIAVPQSWKLAKAFIELGVKHVVCFNFETYIRNEQLISKVFDVIYKFCIQFYKELMSGQSISKSFEVSLGLIFDDISNINSLHMLNQEASGMKVDRNQQDFFSANQAAFLFPQQEGIHSNPIFEVPKQVEDQQKLGKNKRVNKVIDSSIRKRKRFSSSKDQIPFTGRRTLIYNLIAELKRKSIRLINLHGPDGIGKTKLVVETYLYLSDREIFKDGAFYIDLKGVTTRDEFIKKTSDIIMKSCNIDKEEVLDQQLEANSFLLVMDHVDGILSNSSQFDWNVINLITLYKNLKIIIVSRDEIDLKLFESVKDSVIKKEMPPLDDEESVDLVLSNCSRMLLDDMKKRQAIVPMKNGFRHFIKQLPDFRNCGGFPKYLHIFAQQLTLNEVGRFNMKILIQAAGGNTKLISDYGKKWELMQRQMEEERASQCLFPPADQSFQDPPHHQNGADRQNNDNEEMDFFSQLESEHSEQQQHQNLNQGNKPDQWISGFALDQQRRGSMRFGHGQKDNSSNSSLLGKNRRQADLEEQKVPIQALNEQEELETVIKLSLREYEESQSFREAVGPALSRQQSRGDNYNASPYIPPFGMPPPPNFGKPIKQPSLPSLPLENNLSHQASMIQHQKLSDLLNFENTNVLDLDDVDMIDLEHNRSSSTAQQTNGSAGSGQIGGGSAGQLNKNTSAKSNTSLLSQIATSPAPRQYVKKK